MCTVTFVPTEEGFIFTSNRDVSYQRPYAELPKIHMEGYLKVLMPIDPMGSGSWIGLSPYFDAVCLLNGGFVNHKSNPPYRHSRGLVVRDLLRHQDLPKFSSEYNFHGIEPFTLIAIQDKTLYEMVWTGKQLYIKNLPNHQSYIWSSATLYDANIRQKRIDWFQDWLANYPHDLASLRGFHENAGEGNPRTNVMMDWAEMEVGTVSTTTILKENGAHFMHYKDWKTQRSAMVKFESDLVIE
ncbi:NRDE family protein [Persicobacter sp. CCB-QB2]|uniref:NRDE family protein n=1 Tax=Persicobacter sp. CCB-QB2 TaxID=1561025 RepID=UPI0006A957CE|nr:NRDE family protein [Persicobacter sp. CCB-QB2]